MAEKMIEINDEVLEAGVACLTGGVNIEGHPLVAFPPECTIGLLQSSAGALLQLLQYYVRIAGPKISVLLNMRDMWTESGIVKVITVFDELQSERRGTVSNVCILKPVDKARLRVLKRCLLRKAPNGRLLPFYKVHLLETEDEFFSYVNRDQLTVDFGGTLQYNHLAWVDFQKVHLLETEDEFFSYVNRDQLTMDFGGTLQYNHLAWVDFQKSYATTKATTMTLRNKVNVIKSHVMKLLESKGRKSVSDNAEYRQKEIRAKYESILEKHGVRETISKCKDRLERLDIPDEDANLIQIHSKLLIGTKNKLRDALDDIQPVIDEMDSYIDALEDEMTILAQLDECKKNTEEVKETIGLLASQFTDTALVGKDLTEAANFRGYFIETALEPSKDIVACATSVLKNLDGGSKTTQRTYKIAFDIAKELTQSIQPFTKLMNQLNEDYTRMHLFHAMFEKMTRWKTKASLFVIRNLCPLLNDRVALSHRHANSNCSYKINNYQTGSIKTKTVTFKDSSAETLAEEEEMQFNNVINRMEDANREQRVRNISEDEDENHLTAEPRRKPRVQMKYQTCDGEHDYPMITQDEPWGSDGQLEYDTRKSIIIESPCDWNYHLKVFYRKHPPPKKKHLKILTKFAPMDNHQKLRRDASVLAERSMFIVSFLRKKTFKSEEIIRIQQWTEDGCVKDSDTQKNLISHDTCILEVTLV